MKQTVGKIASDLLQKNPGSHNVNEQMQENLTDYEKNIWEAVERGKKQFHKSFYIVVVTKNERLMRNVFRNYFFPRQTCPTPDYDQTVYHYHQKENKLDFVWVIPSRDACHYLRDNALSVVTEEQWLLQFVLEFADGSLYKKCKILNGEREDSPLLATT